MKLCEALQGQRAEPGLVGKLSCLRTLLMEGLVINGGIGRALESLSFKPQPSAQPLWFHLICN